MPRIEIDGWPAFDGRLEETLLEAADRAGVPIEAACGGFAACNTCRVAVFAGELSEVSDEEAPFLDAPEHRLACQARIRGDLRARLAPG